MRPFAGIRHHHSIQAAHDAGHIGAGIDDDGDALLAKLPIPAADLQLCETISLELQCQRQPLDDVQRFEEL